MKKKSQRKLFKGPEPIAMNGWQETKNRPGRVQYFSCYIHLLEHCRPSRTTFHSLNDLNAPELFDYT